jgi:hypothetical protein
MAWCGWMAALARSWRALGLEQAAHAEAAAQRRQRRCKAGRQVMHPPTHLVRQCPGDVLEVGVAQEHGRQQLHPVADAGNHNTAHILGTVPAQRSSAAQWSAAHNHARSLAQPAAGCAQLYPKRAGRLPLHPHGWSPGAGAGPAGQAPDLKRCAKTEVKSRLTWLPSSPMRIVWRSTVRLNASTLEAAACGGRERGGSLGSGGQQAGQRAFPAEHGAAMGAAGECDAWRLARRWRMASS